MNAAHLEKSSPHDLVDSTKEVVAQPALPRVAGFRPSSKIRDRHWERLAIVYIRQSSPHQVLENRESRERQYALAPLAEQMGWPADRILIIDEDQGMSGKSAANRGGFQRLLAEVSLNHVGLVLALELNRLSRSSKDWHHLVEVCAVFNTLLSDQDGIYDAADSNDRLLLGMKGAMSEFELITLRNRLERGRDNKAARGDLYLHLPIGYTKSMTGEVVQEPDEQARGVVQLIFDKFDELGTVWGVHRYLAHHKIQLGFHCLKGPKRGQLEWRRPTPGRLWSILHHPIYAGAYAYGMHQSGQKNPATGRVEGGKKFLPPDEIRVLIRDHVPAYIPWEQYLANRKRISENRSLPTSPGTPRRGLTLLNGLIVCDRCGRRMNVLYHARAKKKPFYACQGHSHGEREQPCYSLKSPPVDELVAQQILRALEPASVDLSLQAAADIERERARLHQHWQQRLERAQFESQRAERQYQSVEPENRLVARTLEQRWEEALHQERQLREEHDRFLAETPKGLSAADQQRIRVASQNICALWQAATNADRKAIVRCLVERVMVHVEPRREYVDVTIQWKGGFSSQHQVVRPVGGFEQLRDYDLLVNRITTLHQAGKSAPAIAEQLNLEGFVPPRRHGLFSVSTVASLLQRFGLSSEVHRPELLGPHEWWIRDLANKLKAPRRKVHYWATRGWIHYRKTDSGRHWIVWADEDELQRLQQLQAQSKSYMAQRNPKLVTPKVRKTIEE